MKKQVIKALGNNALAIEGKVMFSNISEPKGFKDNLDNRTYSITIKIGKEDAEEVMSVVDEIESAAYDAAVKGLTTIQKKAIVKAAPKYKEVGDASGEPTGEIKFEFRRAEARGVPTIYDKEGKKVEEKKFIAKDSDVLVGVVLAPYTVGSTRGLAYRLDSIKILNEVARTGGAGSGSNKAAEELANFMAAVSEDEMPF